MIRLDNLLVLALVASASAPALAHDRGYGHLRRGQRDDGPPLLLGREIEIGGYGGLDVAYTRMFDRDGAVVGLQGALLLDHRLALGVAGYGWTNPQRGPLSEGGEPQRFETGYGGVTLRYSLYADATPIYLTLGALVGGGVISLQEEDHDDGFDAPGRDREDLFAVLQPDVTLHANLTQWLRLGVTAGYRWTRGVGEHGYQEQDVDGLVVGGQLQFGRF